MTTKFTPNLNPPLIIQVLLLIYGFFILVISIVLIIVLVSNSNEYNLAKALSITLSVLILIFLIISLVLFLRNNRIKSKETRDRESNAEKVWVVSDEVSTAVGSGGADASNNSPNDGINLQGSSGRKGGTDGNESNATYLPYTDHEIDCEGLHSSNANRNN